jgi:hypothetical protein
LTANDTRMLSAAGRAKVRSPMNAATLPREEEEEEAEEEDEEEAVLARPGLAAPLPAEGRATDTLTPAGRERLAACAAAVLDPRAGLRDSPEREARATDSSVRIPCNEHTKAHDSKGTY